MPSRSRGTVAPPAPGAAVGLRVLAFGVLVPRDVGDGAEARVVAPRERMPTAAELRAGMVEGGRVVVLAGGAAVRRLGTWLRQPGVLAALDAVLLVHPTIPDEHAVTWLEVAAAAERQGGPLLAWWVAYHDPDQGGGYEQALALLGALREADEPAARAATVDAGGFVWPEGEILSGPGGAAWTEGPLIAHEARGNVVLLVDESERPAPAMFAALYAPGALVRAVLQPRLRLDVPRHPPVEPHGPNSAAIAAIAEDGSRLVVATARAGTSAARELVPLVREARKLWDAIRR